ncbi:TPA: serine hydroxymethyltransferase [Candidatus Berkelbacteria bacterium]|uniref:Serine hydroxymethyltransferase n=1 Tax=Berkelbacteria bacterium GW2011_GWE1_39_12 TaxID=1618337 RepID=A0A0G4B3Y3_9BACT|nr:MAG: serine hydroxymethyltransferase, glycine hydroxymethyltransferase [Berkelbacteria bacterium GW2011_GWE1_39_12]HBO60347.1 serine hydroxymethyltransferase [Candidatus Berkelbacteria bacterium]
MSISKKDPKIAKLISAEEKYENETIDLIPSENYASLEVREALGSILSNKYSEGYPGARYYAGEIYVDQIEEIAKDRALKMFKLSPTKWHANVQPYSGSPANLAVYSSVLEPGDKIMGMKLDQGGHITHGLPISFPGRIFDFAFYGVDEKTEMLDYDEILKIAKKEKPKLIICGATAYSRTIDFKKFAEIAQKVNAYLLADISHIAGLVIGGAHPSPFPYADFVMSTTHKTLRGPRGALIICKKEFQKQIDRAVFPGLQGGPHDNQVAAKAVCFGEALDPDFKIYAKQIVKNAKALARELQGHGFKIVSNGTDNHLMLVDLRTLQITGKDAQLMLEEIGIICNKNTIPLDPEKPFIGSGIRIGTPALTTRGMKEKEMTIVAKLIAATLMKKEAKNKLEKEVVKLAKKFPLE